MKILVIDSVAPKPYSPTMPATLTGLGGSEGSLSRVYMALREQGHHMVLWHPRSEREPYFSPHVVITQRSISDAIAYSNKYPRAKHILWCHDVPTPDFERYAPMLAALNISIVAVSDWHKGQIVDHLLRARLFTPIRVRRIYNPIADNIQPEDTAININKLCFFSSPEKGLTDTIRMFKYARKTLPDLELHISNPGYSESYPFAHEGVYNYGVLCQEAIHKHVREALCTFTYNKTFPETMGLVFAESNALGTPFMALKLGAVTELTNGVEDQIIQPTLEDVIPKLMRWQRDRPTVRLQEKFRTSTIVREWETLFNDIQTSGSKTTTR